MNVLNHVATKIAGLASGEQWVITAQELWLSRSDFQAVSVYLCREAAQGTFSVAPQGTSSAWLGATALKVIKH
jgi:hypothetical protein